MIQLRTFLVGLFLILSSCVTSNKTAIERLPSSYGDWNSPCRDTRDCRSDLLCKSGWCRQPDAKKEAFENCRTYTECLSNRCENNKCVPSGLAPADNDQECFAGVPTNCRSNKVVGDFCQASSYFRGFAGMNCSVDTDCISSRCGPNKKCNAGGDSLSCKWVNEMCSPTDSCCSGNCVNNRCVGRGSLSCNQGQCSNLIGKVCATEGQRVQFETECCSLKMISNYCVKTNSNSPSFCLQNSDCSNGMICHPRDKICVP